MRHELLELYNLAIESCDADIIRAFQRARERIGPQIIIDVLLENAELRERVDLATALLEAAPEINPSNYDHDQVCELNDAVNQVHRLLNEALASQPTPDTPAA